MWNKHTPVDGYTGVKYAHTKWSKEKKTESGRERENERTQDVVKKEYGSERLINKVKR
jgi:hypothetical protein